MLQSGHIKAFHIWPARRPLAACRAALIATLLPDPGTPEKRQELCEKIGGKIVEKIEKKRMPNGQTVERIKEETEEGILSWGSEIQNKELLDFFKAEIRKAYGGRAPKVLDPFAGGGAIPFEAMRLGCEAIANDLNPVAWFILKCTLEYPQKFAGETLPLPDFILQNAEFMEKFYKAKGYAKTEIKKQLEKLGHNVDEKGLFGNENNDLDIEADLAWHVRAWGQWVLDNARKELASYYPAYAEFEPLAKHIHYDSYNLGLKSLLKYKPDFFVIGYDQKTIWEERLRSFLSDNDLNTKILYSKELAQGIHNAHLREARQSPLCTSKLTTQRLVTNGNTDNTIDNHLLMAMESTQKR